MHARELTALAYKESTYKSYSRAWNIFLTFFQAYNVPINDISEGQFMEFISYLSLSGLAPATILLYVAGVRANFHWQGLPTFSNSFVIKMMLKGVTTKHRDPDIRLPVTREILHQMCEALPLILSDYFMVQLYKSMLTLAFHALLRPGEFSYSPHVVRIEHIFVDNMGVTIYLM